MKYLFLFASFFALTTSNFAQTMARNVYTVSGGLLGAINSNSFRIGGDNPDDLSFAYRLGWSAGAWFNLPIGDALSIEPQVMYSLYDFEDNPESTLLPSGKMSYITVPLLLKFHPHNDWAITLGPQFDFLHDLQRVPVDVVKENFASTNVSLSIGLELLPHEPLGLFARYIHGFSSLDNRDPAGDLDYYSSAFQVGFKLKVFGSYTPADTDGDGIADRDDDCPLVAGLVDFQGCPDTDTDGITDAIDECPTIAGILRYNGCPIPDTDKDGVNDEIDKCLTVAGVAKYDGCPVPDTDGDGVNDDNDKCITVAGLERYDGCPIPDGDGDGVNDEVDKCPAVAGLAQFDGCPNPDRDMDGVADASDLCPDVKGPASNAGCPVVESPKFNARMINFKSGSAELTPQSKLSLREGAALMNSNTFDNLVFHIHGHTDHVGSNAYNHDLSHRRAASVRAELIKNGVPAERMTSEGFGETKPIADNETAEGRALNRRVEILARHTQPLEVPK